MRVKPGSEVSRANGEGKSSRKRGRRSREANRRQMKWRVGAAAVPEWQFAVSAVEIRCRCGHEDDSGVAPFNGVDR